MFVRRAFVRTLWLILVVQLSFLRHFLNASDDGGDKNDNTKRTDHAGGVIINEKLVFSKSLSPIWLMNDIIVEKDAELIIEPGVRVEIEPQVGITIRGVLTAVGSIDQPITFTTSKQTSAKFAAFPAIRLTDGPSILSGRLQIHHNGQWRSVCTNSKNWTVFDMQTACRQLGFQGGSFFGWFDRQMPLKPRLLLEEPKCLGTEGSLLECQWSSRQMGAGVCDYHPDLGLSCLSRHDKPLPYWRGIRFEYARYEKELTFSNTLYVPTSLSKLIHVNLRYAGAGRHQNASSALHVRGVPPVISNLAITYSAYNGINITNPYGPININNCTVRNNRGHGIFINSSVGLAKINSCMISGNGGDGIRYVHAEEHPDERIDRSGYYDFCKLAIVSSQTFPMQLFVEQSVFLNQPLNCNKVFTTRYGYVITMHFLRAVNERNNTAAIEIYDGSSFGNRLISRFSIRNNTRPQSLTSTGNQMFIKFSAEAKTSVVIFIRIVSHLSKSYDLFVSNSDISENSGRGIAVDNLRSQVHIFRSAISKNQHVAGLHVTSGVGDINVTESRISFNDADGINITYTGGSRNISKTSISSNQGYGIAIWLNNTRETEFIFANQTTVVQYSDIYKNLDTGILHGNYCGEALFNFTANKFKNCPSDALEVITCWQATTQSTKLQIGHNEFIGNEQISLKISPALNVQATIEYNHFRQGRLGSILIKNKPLEEFNVLPNDIIVHQNYFINNTGVFVVNFALSPYSQLQHLLFYRNFVKNNKITERFSSGTMSLNPRSRVAAPIVIGSNNVDIFRNIIENSESQYEIGSHLEDQSKTINCTCNWLGYSRDEQIFYRLFHRYDRYNLAKINFIPYLLHNTNPLTTKINSYQLFVPKFLDSHLNKIGGEVEGEETLSRGEYIVERDINIRPGGKLTIEPGVTLKFPHAIGMMVGGQLEARGIEPDSIKFTMKEEITYQPDNSTYEIVTEQYNTETEIIEIEPKIPVRLLGGAVEYEGRLQIKLNNEWGTVCNYGWTMKNAALVCLQLGYVLNPDDWFIERNEMPAAGTSENILLANVDCNDFDVDITKCKAENRQNFEFSCDHDNDVAIRCYKTSWAGVRFGALAERSNIQYITIEKAGLLDYSTNVFKPALQLDFSKHNFENIKVSNNLHHGLGVLYTNIYTNDVVNTIKNSDFSNNKGAGISFKQLGFNVFGSTIENNFIGILHDPVVGGLQQRELAGWYIKNEDETDYNPFLIPYSSDQNVIQIQHDETKHLVTSKVVNGEISKLYRIRCPPGRVIGIQLLNPINNRSTENIIIYDSLTLHKNSDIWILKRDLTVFPTTSSSHGIILSYESGNNSVGGTVLVLTSIVAPVQNVYNRIVKGPIPTLNIQNSKVKNNNFGVYIAYYNRYLNEMGDHFLRKANETLKFTNCEISHNTNEAIFVHTPHWDLHRSNLSEITIMINNSLITDNGKGIYHFSKDVRSSNNLFHYIFQDDTFERNEIGGFIVTLPYVWTYNENFTHSIYIDNSTWLNNRNFGFKIDGHFAIVNITNNKFKTNKCTTGLISFNGMEKKLLISRNKLIDNSGKFVVQFASDSQSEIIGEVPATFIFNEFRRNKEVPVGAVKLENMLINVEPSSVIYFNGIQKVNVNRNLFSKNTLDFNLLAGIKTAKIKNFLNVKENWWGTTDEYLLKQKIFDFDDWNNHAVATYRPFLMNDDFFANVISPPSRNDSIDLDNLGGRITEDILLSNRDKPYRVTADITIMPDVTMTIYSGVTMEFGPNIGILVLGILKARGFKGNEIIMKPMSDNNYYYTETHKRRLRQMEPIRKPKSIRLCQEHSCNQASRSREGFLEYFNSTTLQWIPICDLRFTERNAQVVCFELGFDPLNAFFDHDIRVDFHSNTLSRIWSWPQPLQCSGNERRYEDCEIRLNGQQYGHEHRCKWNSKFVFIQCGERNLEEASYWGGIRFADGNFEQKMYAHRLHDITTHTTVQNQESLLEYVKIIGAGILHNEKSPAVQSIKKSPKINHVEISQSASHGMNFISPSDTLTLLHNTVEDSMGVGINVLSVTGEGRESEESSFTPLKGLNIPYNLFSLVDICDTHKEIQIEERILLYYKYDNHPVNCIKIFNSAYNIKPLGFRLLQFDLFNSTSKYGIPDFLSLYDGDIYNVSSKLIAHITMQSHTEKKLFKTKLPSLSIKLFANGASSNHGFIAEVVTLPISAIGFNRDVQHNISYSGFVNNRQGAILYMSAGEVNPIITIDKNRFMHNCEKLYGNFTTCRSAIEMDVQNTQTIYFRDNLVQDNQGGLSIKADSRGSATSLKAFVHNNLFVNNSDLPVLYVEGRQSSPYQEVTIYRNYFTRNHACYSNNIILRQVVSNFTFNYVKRNIGLQTLEVSGFDKVRLPIYQTTSHNGFYHNYAIHPNSRSTIVAGTAGQQYVDNILFNPDNDYEMITINRSLFEYNSTLQLWNTKIDAAYNYWGFNTSLAVTGRIRDQSDDPTLLEVTYFPYYMNNQSVLLDGKCPPGWDLVGDTCYMYIGAPMTFHEAKAFCQADNASLPFLLGNFNYFALYDFLRKQQQWYLYSDRVWIQHIDRINECTMFAYQAIEVYDCNETSAFICEIDPKVSISILPLADDLITISVVSSLVLALILMGVLAMCWWSKSKYRKIQRLERRNSIRQSLHSLRSVGLAPSSFSDASYRRKAAQLSTRSTDTLTHHTDYKKMISNGSFDSMEKSTYQSSVEDNRSFDIYETHNPNPSSFRYSPTIEYHTATSRYTDEFSKPSAFELAYKNAGFRDNSTFATNSRAESVTHYSSADECPQTQDNCIDYYNQDTLPIDNADTSTMDTKDSTKSIGKYNPSFMRNRPTSNIVAELKGKFGELPPPPDPPVLNSFRHEGDYNTNGLPSKNSSPSSVKHNADDTFREMPEMAKMRSKSAVLLETDFDFMPSNGNIPDFNHPIGNESRSKSQPLETAM